MSKGQKTNLKSSDKQCYLLLHKQNNVKIVSYLFQLETKTTSDSKNGWMSADDGLRKRLFNKYFGYS